MHSYLQKVFRFIIKPLVAALRSIMQFFGFANESFLYAADLRFRLGDDDKCMEGFKSTSMKNEDAQQNLNDKVRVLKDRYRSKFNEMVAQAQ